MIEFLLGIPKDEDTNNHLRELNMPIIQDGENPANGFLCTIDDIETNCDFYEIPETYNDNIDLFKIEYFNKVLTINDLNIYGR